MRTRIVPVFLVISAAASTIASCSASGGDAPSQPGAGGSYAGSVGASGSGGSGGSGLSSSTGGSGGTGNVGIGATGGGAPSDANGEGDGCGASTITAEKIPGEVLVVFDQSLSMAEMWGAKPKWLAASDALFSAVQAMGDQVQIGALFVPNHCPPSTSGRPANCTDPSGSGPCSLVYAINDPGNIQIQPGTQFLQKWVAHFQPPWTTISGTPWDKAFAEANVVFPTAAANGAQRAVVLVSDGAPTCPIGDPTPTIPHAQALLAKGIKTYVIGVPGAAADSSVLNSLAQAGGTNQYIDASQPQQVTQALTDLSKTILGCVFQFDPPPPALDDVHLIGWDAATPGGFEVPKGTDGWELSPDGKTATLVGAACEKATAGGFDKIQFIFGCPDAVIEPPR